MPRNLLLTFGHNYERLIWFRNRNEPSRRTSSYDSHEAIVYFCKSQFGPGDYNLFYDDHALNTDAEVFAALENAQENDRDGILRLRVELVNENEDGEEESESDAEDGADNSSYSSSTESEESSSSESDNNEDASQDELHMFLRPRRCYYCKNVTAPENLQNFNDGDDHACSSCVERYEYEEYFSPVYTGNGRLLLQLIQRLRSS